MMWNGTGMGGWGLGMMLVSNLLFLALLLGGGYMLYRAVRRDEGGDANRSSAKQVLDERYARGEIDDEEYRHRLATMRTR